MNNLLNGQGIENPEIQWLIKVDVGLILLGSTAAGIIFDFQSFSGFLIGALLGFFNFFLLARRMTYFVLTPKRAAIIKLLVFFYLRLLFTALILFISIAGIQLSAISILTGFSTLVLTLIIWIGRYFVNYKIKEAQIDGY